MNPRETDTIKDELKLYHDAIMVRISADALPPHLRDTSITPLFLEHVLSCAWAAVEADRQKRSDEWLRRHSLAALIITNTSDVDMHIDPASIAPMLADDRLKREGIGDLVQRAKPLRPGETLCGDCPPVGYPTDTTRCHGCPRRGAPPTFEPPSQTASPNPRVTDNDKGEITVSLDGKELRGWSYENDDERRRKMLQAREYVEGWCDGRDAAAVGSDQLRTALRDCVEQNEACFANHYGDNPEGGALPAYIVRARELVQHLTPFNVRS